MEREDIFDSRTSSSNEIKSNFSWGDAFKNLSTMGTYGLLKKMKAAKDSLKKADENSVLFKQKSQELDAIKAQLEQQQALINKELAKDDSNSYVPMDSQKSDSNGGISPLMIGGIVLGLAVLGGGIVWYIKRNK